MNTIRIGIVEDEVIIAKAISLYLNNLGYKVVFTVGTAEKALTKLSEIDTDLVLLDINLMAEKNGIDLAELINEQYNVPFIYITSNCDANTLQKAKKTAPLAFLVKPIKQHDLFSCIEIAMTNFERLKKSNSPSNNHLIVKIGDIYKKIMFIDICYLENNQNYIDINLTDGSKEVVRASFADVLSKLPTNQFTQISRFHIINHQYLTETKTNTVRIAQIELPIRKEKREELLAKI